jgi:hypothetical protein
MLDVVGPILNSTSTEKEQQTSLADVCDRCGAVRRALGKKRGEKSTSGQLVCGGPEPICRWNPVKFNAVSGSQARICQIIFT